MKRLDAPAVKPSRTADLQTPPNAGPDRKPRQARNSRPRKRQLTQSRPVARLNRAIPTNLKMPAGADAGIAGVANGTQPGSPRAKMPAAVGRSVNRCVA